LTSSIHTDLSAGRPRCTSTCDVTRRVSVEMGDRTMLKEYVAYARGHLARPMTPSGVRDKARGLVEPVLPGIFELPAAAADDIPGAAGLSELANLCSTAARV
jgi:hypothetical protein